MVENAQNIFERLSNELVSVFAYEVGNWVTAGKEV